MDGFTDLLIGTAAADVAAHGFIDVGIGDLRWPTFNVADMAVSVGAFMLAWVLWGEERSSPPVVATAPVSDTPAES